MVKIKNGRSHSGGIILRITMRFVIDKCINLCHSQYKITQMFFNYFARMERNQRFDLEIDKLTRSIENAVSGDSFKTEVIVLTPADIRKLKKLIGYLTGRQSLKFLTELFTNWLLLTMQLLFRDSSVWRTGVTIFLCRLLKAVNLIVV